MHDMNKFDIYHSIRCKYRSEWNDPAEGVRSWNCINLLDKEKRPTSVPMETTR